MGARYSSNHIPREMYGRSAEMEVYYIMSMSIEDEMRWGRRLALWLVVPNHIILSYHNNALQLE